MTKSKSDIENLLRPRYKVMADYPSNKFPVGQILPLIEPYDSVVKAFDQYPHLFKKLYWWEDRKPEEMPEYIRFYEPLPEKFSIWKVNEWRFGLKRPLVKTDCDVVWRELSIGDLPATLDEYNHFINKDK